MQEGGEDILVHLVNNMLQEEEDMVHVVNNMLQEEVYGVNNMVQILLEGKEQHFHWSDLTEAVLVSIQMKKDSSS